MVTRTVFTDAEWDALREAASELGREHGTNAGSWVPVEDVDSARTWLRGMADGDPAVLDSLPDSGLSGEWADEFDAGDLYRHLGIGPDDDSDDAELCTAYSDAYRDAVHAEVQRRAVYQLSGEDSER